MNRRAEERARHGARAKVGTALVAATAALLAMSGAGAHGAGASPAPETAWNTVGVPPSQFSQSGPNGMNIDAAEASYTSGDPRVTIAYIEGGVNLHDKGFTSAMDGVLYVNWHETPVPCVGATLATATMTVGGVTKPCATTYSTNEADYDLDHDGVVNAKEWANDPRVRDANANGAIDPEDLVAAFSDGADHDGNQFANDIFGWDFYEHQNDPATQDGDYEHSDDMMGTIHGLCPKCMIMPIRAGDEALDATQNLAQAWTYACANGANIVVSVTADLGYSSAMHDAIDYCNAKGAVMLESSNDFDSQDHQGGMFWPYVIPGNGAVSNVQGLPSTVSPVRYWTRSDETSWGPHNVFTAATGGGSTSESTPTLGAVLGLVLSEGFHAYDLHQIASPLTGQEVVQLVRETATPFTDPSLPWPGAPGEWNPQYGYGMPNVDAAMRRIAAGAIPPTVQITSPQWYSIEDPTVTKAIPVTGAIGCTRSPSCTWRIEAGVGEMPSSWFPIGSGSLSGSFTGTLGTLDLSAIPSAMWSAPMAMSSDKELSTADRYDVTLRVVVTDAGGRTGVDRRAIEVVHDPTWLPGFPKRIGPSGESQPALADLQGTGHLDIVFADADGQIQAIDPATGAELPGWPQHTLAQPSPASYPGVSFGDEPVLEPVAVGDLTHTGHLDVVVTSSTGHVYAYDAYGNLLPGWPKVVDRNVSTLPIPRPNNPITRQPIEGAIAPPVLADLTGDGTLDVVQAGLDGYVHAWRPDGTGVPGWPVKVSLPSGFSPASGYSLIDDQRVISPPAIVHFGGPGTPPDLVVRTQYTEVQTGYLGSIAPLPLSISMAYDATGHPLAGWPVVLPGLVEYYGSAMDALTEGTTAPIALTTPGSSQGQVIIEPLWTPPYVVNGNGTVASQIGDMGGAGASLLAVEGNHTLVLTPSKLPASVPVPFVNLGAVGSVGGRLSFVSSAMGTTSFAAAELVDGSGFAIDNQVEAYPVTGGTVEDAGFPAERQGADFLAGPIVTDVTGSGVPDIVEGGDASALAAYTPSGALAPGFPKYTGGWTTASPAAGDLLTTGHVDLVATSREGYLMAWSTPGVDSGNNQWWHSFADEWNDDAYGTDTRPPGVIRSPSWPSGGDTVSFVAPGDDWYSGTATAYDVLYEPSGIAASVRATVGAGGVQSLTVPAGTTSVVIQAVDAAGNLATPVTVTLGEGPSPGSSPGTGPAAVPGALSAATGVPIAGELLFGALLVLAGLATAAGLIVSRRRRPLRS